MKIDIEWLIEAAKAADDASTEAGRGIRILVQTDGVWVKGQDRELAYSVVVAWREIAAARANIIPLAVERVARKLDAGRVEHGVPS